MPNIKSAKKRVSVTASKNLQNKIQKSIMKTNLKKLYTLVSENKDAEALNKAYKCIDQCAAKGIMHQNAAARKKSQFAAAMK